MIFFAALGLRPLLIGTVEIPLRNLNITAIVDETFDIDCTICPKAEKMVQKQLLIDGERPQLRISVRWIVADSV